MFLNVFTFKFLSLRERLGVGFYLFWQSSPTFAPQTGQSTPFSLSKGLLLLQVPLNSPCFKKIFLTPSKAKAMPMIPIAKMVVVSAIMIANLLKLKLSICQFKTPNKFIWLLL